MAVTAVTSRLHGSGLTLGYDGRVVSESLDVRIPDGSFTIVVGPNACGKSTLLRALARMLRPSCGEVVLDGHEIGSLPSKEVARRLGLLPQSPTAPDAITVADLVARGRYPHQGLLRQWSRGDEAAVAAAMRATRVDDLAGRAVDELSGGQRQRVWLAMVLAQETRILLLDEPTTFLHDLNHACRYATHLIAMKDGAVIAEGTPGAIVDAELVEQVFGLRCRVVEDPETGTPLIVPAARGRRQRSPAETAGVSSSTA